MRTLKLILIIFLTFMIVGCTKDVPVDDGGTDEIIELPEPTLTIEQTSYRLEAGRTLKLNIIIENGAEDLPIIYVSSAEDVAIVLSDGTVIGKKAGEATITAILANYPDQKLNIQVTVYEVSADELRARIEFANIKKQLEEMIPNEVDNDITLYSTIGSRFLDWETSNSAVIDKFGNVYRQDEDVLVTLKATMQYKDIVDVFEKTVTVKKRLPMRDLSQTKVSMAYSTVPNIKVEHLEKLDVVNYSFGTISSDYKLIVSNTISNLIRKAHNYGVRVVVAVGGGTSDATKTYQDMAKSKETRKVFIDSIISALRTYNFDGIDYDWEYPTQSEKELFTELVKETREALDKYKPGLLLTAAFGAAAGRVNVNYNVRELNKYLDYFNMMTYDYNAWSTPFDTRHHTNLYTSQIASRAYSADSAIKAFIAGGADPKKIVMGVAAYGRKATNVQATSATINGINGLSDNAKLSIKLDEIYRIYYENPNTKYVRYWDDDAKAAWLFDGETFISYDDEESIKEKCKYTLENNLGGVMYWEYNSDTKGHVIEFLHKYLNKTLKA